MLCTKVRIVFLNFFHSSIYAFRKGTLSTKNCVPTPSESYRNFLPPNFVSHCFLIQVSIIPIIDFSLIERSLLGRLLIVNFEIRYFVCFCKTQIMWSFLPSNYFNLVALWILQWYMFWLRNSLVLSLITSSFSRLRGIRTYNLLLICKCSALRATVERLWLFHLSTVNVWFEANYLRISIASHNKP